MIAIKNGGRGKNWTRLI